MRLIDMHCDTLWKLIEDKQSGLQGNAYCVDIGKMKQAGVMAQFFACFVYMDQFMGSERYDKGYELALDMIARGKEEFVRNEKQISLTYNYDELMKNKTQGKMSAFLTVEEGGILDGQMERLEELYDKGVRLMTLLWNHENCIGYPNSRDAHIMKKGLKSFGIEVVERMNELRMIIDVSHMSDGGFWDILSLSKSPVIASHSNARALCNHPRNLSDEMIRALSEKGGITGLNLYPYFVNPEGKADVQDIVEHVLYMMKVGGEDFVAIGTDFDGFDEGELSITDIGQMEKLHDALRKKGITERQLGKIWYKNALRVIREV